MRAKTAVTIVLLFAVSQLGAAPRARARQRLELNAMEMLDLYERRRDLALTGLQDKLQIVSIYGELTGGAKKWISEKGPAEAPRRRLVLATFVLEVVQHMAPTREMSPAESTVRALAWAGAPPKAAPNSTGAPPRTSLDPLTNWGVALRLLQFVRQELVNQKEPLPLETVWHQALIGLLEYYGHTDGLYEELNYMRERYPHDTAFLLPHAWAEYYSYRPPPPSMLWADKVVKDHIWDTWDTGLFHFGEDYYADALANPPTAAEARVRIGEMRVKRNDADGALEILHEVDMMSHDKEVRYLSSLEQAWAYLLKDDKPHAMDSYRRALAFVPDAQAASVGLAGLLVIDGQPDEANDVMTRALTGDVLDPWMFHRYPAYMHFDELLERLRTELK
jgi:tetratricopeptide (TPR) repeat protein